MAPDYFPSVRQAEFRLFRHLLPEVRPRQRLHGWVEYIQDHSSAFRQCVVDAAQAGQLLVDRRQVLEGPEW